MCPSRKLNVCPSTLQEGYGTYSPLARKRLFDGCLVSPFFSEPAPDTETDQANEAVKGIGRISRKISPPYWAILKTMQGRIINMTRLAMRSVPKSYIDT